MTTDAGSNDVIQAANCHDQYHISDSPPTKLVSHVRDSPHHGRSLLKYTSASTETPMPTEPAVPTMKWWNVAPAVFSQKRGSEIRLLAEG
ncbi:hypothetical protein [Streptomyces sp. NPDC003393]